MTQSLTTRQKHTNKDIKAYPLIEEASQLNHHGQKLTSKPSWASNHSLQRKIYEQKIQETSILNIFKEDKAQTSCEHQKQTQQH